MVNLLKGVVQGVRSKEKHLTGKKTGKTIGVRGTGGSLKSEGHPYKLKAEIGGKTGTTQKDRTTQRNKSEKCYI